MIFLIPRILALTFLLLLAGCSSLISNPTILMLRHVIPTNADKSVRFDPAFHYLRLVVEDNDIFLASGTLNIDSANTVSVWYSAEREVLRFQNGRLVAAVGLTTEWRGVTIPELPAWSELALAKEPFSWTRTRDVMPGYRYGVRDYLLLRRIPAPNDSLLKGIDPHALTWFEEKPVWCCTANVQNDFVGRVSTRHVGLKPDLQGLAHKCRQEQCTALEDFQNGVSTPEDALPRARYAVDFRDGKETVVYGEQCVSAKLCFSWQRWPVQAGGKE